MMKDRSCPFWDQTTGRKLRVDSTFEIKIGSEVIKPTPNFKYKKNQAQLHQQEILPLIWNSNSSLKHT